MTRTSTTPARPARRTSRIAAGLAAAATTVAVAVPSAMASSATATAGTPTVTGAWARATAPVAKDGAVYFTIKGGSAADRLTGAKADMMVAMSATLHKTAMESGGMMSMASVKAVPVPAGKTVTFKPGGYHVMLMGLKAPLKVGAAFKLTLVFAKAGAKSVTVTVRR